MSDYGDDPDAALYDDFDFDDDDAWLYIPEDDTAADALAEHAVASPPPSFTPGDDGYDSDVFAYWIDIEYNSDGYHDAEPHHQQPLSKKRRRTRAPGSPPKKKRRAASAQDSEEDADGAKLSPTPTVVWLSRARRQDLADRVSRGRPFAAESKDTFALLKDWRTRFASPTPKPKPSPETTADKPTAIPDNAADDADEEDDWEEEDGDEANPEATDLNDLLGPSGIDPAALTRALSENLAAAGGTIPAGLDQATLLRYALRMLGGAPAADEDEEGEAGADDADAIAGELADEMFAAAEDDEDAEGEIEAWVRGRRGEAGKENESVDGGPVEEEVPGGRDADAPPDPSPPRTRKRKRKAATPAAADGDGDGDAEPEPESESVPVPEPEPEPEPEEQAPRPKRACRSFERPTATSRAKAVGRENGGGGGGGGSARGGRGKGRGGKR
ncbi:uncharacterized protein K452DRAFT_320706 [Aplosporella prunicola CBS 121167]|uniref:Uncharacterized protein n=1 Tax=Aplosporella prunicola CBS 121167 TaxID=1176127 RepID=A0A6A6B774_9PEZI|nr:uncharacterized protein K452DRAFT_320706 [Aplosporella prunicola CBS 121167]KAF2139085.1 hypothetical protein K452DRAFT_320706 [Aplosporella prunicola CBS 121167]